MILISLVLSACVSLNEQSFERKAVPYFLFPILKTKEVNYSQKAPDLIGQVERGERLVASAAWWGFNADDATVYIQQALDSKASLIVIPNMGQVWNVDPLFLKSNKTVYLEPGTVIAARRGSYRGKGDCLLTLAEIENVNLLGYGAVLQMYKEDYMSAPYKRSEWRHAIQVRGCRNIRIFGLEIKSSGGDGIYIRGLGKKAGRRRYSENIHIRDVILTDNHRQGISVISAEKLLIEKSLIRNTSGTLPQAGIDFEPNFPDESLRDCIVRDCLIIGNKGAGVQFYLKNFNQTSQPLLVYLENNRVYDNFMGIIIAALWGNPPGNIFFNNNHLQWINIIPKDSSLTINMDEEGERGRPVALFKVTADGGNWILDASASYDPDKPSMIVGWLWDLNNDGVFADAEGEVITIKKQAIAGDSKKHAGYIPTVALKVLDDDYKWSETATVKSY